MSLVIKSFNEPDETKEIEGLSMGVCNLGSTNAARMTVQPGWCWSKVIKPLVGGDSCQASHCGFCEEGSMMIKMDDGTEHLIEAGSTYFIPPGHDGWVVGDKPIKGYEFNSTTAVHYGSEEVNEEKKEGSSPLTVSVKSFDEPDETKELENVTVQVCNLGSTVAARMTAQPGWSWSKNIKPLVGGDSCQQAHIGFLQEGTLMVKMDDGTEQQIEAGNTYSIPPGHDGWVVGDAPIVGYEFNPVAAKTYGSTEEKVEEKVEEKTEA